MGDAFEHPLMVISEMILTFFLGGCHINPLQVGHVHPFSIAKSSMGINGDISWDIQ